MTLQASSFKFGGISPILSLPKTSPRRFVIRAKVEPSEKSVEVMRKFSEQYARRSGTYFCMDKGVTSVVIKFMINKNSFRIFGQGLAEHKDTLGAPLCPCRHYDDKAAEAAQGFWNCPCVPMRERKECHCMLFLTPDNDFAGEDQSITSEEIKETTANM
ncbi:ferredoxin-thioredoxin reductase catalytic chain, chloroplastic-like isoform X1 [Hibiscus syriacus]|uniref:ferredoxin-thioredoxin reductase catalytic chain, chloroplastic-like isoform X1 n=1 Tax=Hibiscus syriacus TaxID=106335 RepID=UPI0019250CA9|nr:ferredoxin-thioredoxin reductase catalytic chain, chloroplastic-like isoform X1 [Hibiscus syriacus]